MLASANGYIKNKIEVKIMKKRLIESILPVALIMIVLTGLYSATLAQTTPWIVKADMSNGRHSFTASVVDDRIYAIGGRYTLDLVTEYDPVSDTWSTKASMPTSRMLPASGTVDEKIYVIGGVVTAFAPALSTVEAYDPETDTWTAKKNMLTQRLGHSVSVVDGKIYVIAGMTSGPDFWSGIQSSVEVYDPLTDTWSTKSNMPTPRIWLSTSVVDGKIYAIGGLLLTTEALSTVEVYDPATDTWTTKTPMPTARAGHAAAVVDGIIYVIAGGTHSGHNFTAVEAYDPATDIWTSRNELPELKSFFSACDVNGKIYAIGGITNFANPHLAGEKTVYEYNASNATTGVQIPFQGYNHPMQFELCQNYPNPFNPDTSIMFDVLKTSRVVLKVLNMQAQVVRALIDQEMTPGSYQAIWDGRDSAGKPVVSGTYLCQYNAGAFHQIRKMVLIR